MNTNNEAIFASAGMPPFTVWLFCRVIDNYGDIGVAWRLARQLVCEQGLRVWLWVDDWQAVQKILPDLDVASTQHQGVGLLHWQDDGVAELMASVPAAEVVIETFGCEVPPAVLQWMCAKPVLWLNLDYLSAESWVDGVHLLPSLQANGVQKFFFCPGFSAQTGGLSYEQTLKQQPLPVSAMKQQAYRTHYRLYSEPDAKHVYLFGYPDKMWGEWLHMWATGSEKTIVWLTLGDLLDDLQHHCPELQTLHNVGDIAHCGRLTVAVAPFVAQAEFDEVLQAADVCVVRGEDSVLRALWQGRVFWWQIYRQQDDVHHIKLHAFWQCCLAAQQGLQDAQAPSSWQALWQAHQCLSDELNGVHMLSMNRRRHAWQLVLTQQKQLVQWMQTWRAQLWQRDSLSTQLANFIRHQLK